MCGVPTTEKQTIIDEISCRYDLEGEQNREKDIRDHTSCCNDYRWKQDMQQGVTTSGYGQSGQNGTVERMLIITPPIEE